MSKNTSKLFIKFGENLTRLYAQFQKQKVEERNPLFQTWYWEDGGVIKAVTLQKSWMGTSFTVALSLDTKIDNKYDHIGVINERLTHLIYNHDFWWDYDKDDPLSVDKAISDAMEGLQKYAFKWWEAHLNEVSNARKEYNIRQEKIESGDKLGRQIKEKAAEVIDKEVLEVFPNLTKWTRSKRKDEFLYYFNNNDNKVWIKLSCYGGYGSADSDSVSVNLFIDLFLGNKRPYFGGRRVGPTGLQPQEQVDHAYVESVFKTYIWLLDIASAEQVVKQALTKTKEVLPQFLLESG